MGRMFWMSLVGSLALVCSLGYLAMDEANPLGAYLFWPVVALLAAAGGGLTFGARGRPIEQVGRGIFGGLAGGVVLYGGLYVWISLYMRGTI